MLICTKCKQFKDESKFNRCKQNKNRSCLSYICKDCQKVYDDDARKDKKKQYTKEHSLEKRDYYNKYNKEHREEKLKYNHEHKEHYRVINRIYQEKHREELKEKDKIRNKVRQLDLKYRLSKNISNNIYHSIKDNKSERHWENLVSYTLKELKEHLELQFDSFMTWKNYGEYWEIDHIIPINTF